MNCLFFLVAPFDEKFMYITRVGWKWIIFHNEVQKLLDQNDSRRPKQRLALKNEMWSVKPLSDGQVIYNILAKDPVWKYEYECMCMVEHAPSLGLLLFSFYASTTKVSGSKEMLLFLTDWFVWELFVLCGFCYSGQLLDSPFVNYFILMR